MDMCGCPERGLSMQPIDFTTIVLPLGISVVLLVVTIMILETRKEKIQDKKIKRTIEKLTKEKLDKQQAFKKEQEELDRLHESKSIDNDTYNRLSTLMQMNMQKYDETMNSLLRENMANKPKSKPKPKIAAPKITF
jgi:hypothetical protein